MGENVLSKSHFRQYFSQMEDLSIIVQYYICLGVLLTYSVEKMIQMALWALVPPPRGSKYPHPRGEICWSQMNHTPRGMPIAQKESRKSSWKDYFWPGFLNYPCPLLNKR